MEVDHIFLRAKYDAPEADLLREFGLTEGSGNKHPGQGTENRRFFFRNTFIEFLWICDEQEIKSRVTRPTLLYERLADSSGTASPFGVCFRPTAGQSQIPFPVLDYTPNYLPEGMTIGIGKDVPLSEPMWFFFENGMRPDTAPIELRQPLVHATDVREISSISITIPRCQTWSAGAIAAMGKGGMIIVEGDRYLMEITFDGAASGQQHDFRPILPLVFNY